MILSKEAAELLVTAVSEGSMIQSESFKGCGVKVGPIQFADEGDDRMVERYRSAIKELLSKDLIQDAFVTQNGYYKPTDAGYRAADMLKDKPFPKTTSIQIEPVSVMSGVSVDIFISHSSKDKDLAEKFIELIVNALHISDKHIICTSVDGYRLDLGAKTDEVLPDQILACKVHIGLITDSSIESAYVLFELGARWGAKKKLLPILAKTGMSGLLRGPLSGYNALCLDNASQIHQIIKNLAEELDLTPTDPSVYHKYIDRLLKP